MRPIRQRTTPGSRILLGSTTRPVKAIGCMSVTISYRHGRGMDEAKPSAEGPAWVEVQTRSLYMRHWPRRDTLRLSFELAGERGLGFAQGSRPARAQR